LTSQSETDAQAAAGDAVALITRALQREPSAVRALVDLLSPVIARRVTTALWRRDPRRDFRTEAKDMTQEVFVALFASDGKALRAWDPARGALTTFIGLLAQHQVSSILRTGKTSPWADDPTEAAAFDRLHASEPTPEAVIGSRERVTTLLERVRQRLSPEGLVLFQRLILDEESIDELAASTGMSRDALYQRKTRLLKLVREVAAEMDGLVSEPAVTPRSSKGGVSR
jgi:DNA-directed RNA polymerase specialized sigma24 family protein